MYYLLLTQHYVLFYLLLTTYYVHVLRTTYHVLLTTYYLLVLCTMHYLPPSVLTVWEHSDYFARTPSDWFAY